MKIINPCAVCHAMCLSFYIACSYHLAHRKKVVPCSTMTFLPKNSRIYRRFWNQQRWQNFCAFIRIPSINWSNGVIYLLFVWENPGESPAEIFPLFSNRWNNTKTPLECKSFKRSFFFITPATNWRKHPAPWKRWAIHNPARSGCRSRFGWYCPARSGCLPPAFGRPNLSATSAFSAVPPEFGLRKYSFYRYNHRSSYRHRVPQSTQKYVKDQYFAWL